MCLPRPTAAILAALLTVLALPFLAAPAASADTTARATATFPATTGGAARDPRTEHQGVEHTPLTVRLLAMSPATIPVRGPIVLRGTVSNVSDTTWEDINVLPFISDEPITTRAELSEQAATDESAEVAERLTHPEMFVSIGDLAPGQSTSFRIRMPRRLLPISGTPGAYWIGAHALGTDEQGRDSFADGRARTFIPLVPRNQQGSTAVALVLPLREEVNRTDRGRLADADRWAARLSANGALGRLLSFAESAGAQPFTWLIDPADLDAAADLAAGNPPMSLGEARPEPPEESPEESPGESPAPTAGSGDAGSAGASRFAVPVEEVSSDWLERLIETTRGQVVLGLGYGDPDVASLVHRRPSMLEKARRLAEQRFAARDIDTTSAIVPPDGWLDEDSVATADAEMVLLSDHGEEQERTRWKTGTGSDLVLSDERVLEGGPTPADPLDALALRQRILADAALRALDGVESPLPVVLPAGWDPGPGWRSADFFAGLGQPWLSLVSLSPGSTADLPTYPTPLRYPDRVRQREIPQANVRAASQLINVGALYNQLLDTTNDVYRQLLGAGLLAVSYHARDEPVDVRQQTLSHAAALEEQLEAIHVELGTDFVTLSGGEGVLTASLVNDLEQPVTVGIRAFTEDPGVTITAPDPVRIGPGERVAVRLHAEASTIGVHEVLLTPVTEGGRLVGDPLSFNLRTSQVGRLIWYILIGVGALLAVAIVLRIAHRVRSHRWRR